MTCQSIAKRSTLVRGWGWCQVKRTLDSDMEVFLLLCLRLSGIFVGVGEGVWRQVEY